MVFPPLAGSVLWRKWGGLARRRRPPAGRAGVRPDAHTGPSGDGRLTAYGGKTVVLFEEDKLSDRVILLIS